MAQRKSPPPAAKKSGSRPAGTTGSGARPAGTARSSGTNRPPRKPGKSIVNQRQTPWALIITVIVLVLFAAGIVTYVVAHKSGNSGMSTSDKANKFYEQPEVPAAKKIQGLIWKTHTAHNHVPGTVSYDTSPPTGGNHSPYWADCQGVVYDHQLANENTVHMLEHGAVWITYNPKTASAADVAKLKTMVDGVNFTALTPYADLKTPISLQAWNYQLFVNSASDPRIPQFIDALRHNPKVTPEHGASCSDPQFQASKSTPGHPFEG